MAERNSIDEWYQFAENMKQHHTQQTTSSKKSIKPSSTKGKENNGRYEQLTLPGIELTEESAPVPRTRASVYDFAPEDYRIDIMKSGKNAVDLMSRLLSDSRLSDLCKHCAADSNFRMSNVSKKEKSRLILAQFQQYPECFHYIFTWDEYDWIRRYLTVSGNDIPLPDDPMTIARLQSLGLVEYQFWVESGTEIAEITVPADMEIIFRDVKAKQLKRTYAWIQSNADILLGLMTLYGIIEIDELFAGYSDKFESLETSGDFRRFVYLHAMYNNLVATGNSLGRDFIIHANLNPQKIMPQFLRHPDIPYKLFSDDDIDCILDGICHYNKAWDLYFTNLTYSRALIEKGEEAATKEAEVRCNETFELVLEGKPLNEIIASCRKNIELSENGSIEDEVELWDSAIQLAMETPIPLFRGHTRSEALNTLRMSPDDLCLLPDKKPTKITKTTHIADMDLELQLELYDMIFTDEDFSCRYDEILKEIGCANYEIRFMKICELVMSGDYNRAEAETKQLLKESGDQTLNNQLEYINNYRDVADDAEDFEEEFFSGGAGSFDRNGPDDSPNVSDSLAQLFGFPNEFAASGNGTCSGIADDGFWSQPSTTYKRVQPKIGRNDPCPCGSGKKYKQCCGK